LPIHSGTGIHYHRPMTSPVIRLARPEDAAALARLAVETFRRTFVVDYPMNYPEEDLAAFLRESYAVERVAAWIVDPAGQVLVAEADGVLVAYAQVGDNGLPCADAKPGDGELKRLYVSKAAQGTGLGRELLERSLAWLGERTTYIGVWSGNDRARRLYGRYGFEKVGGYQFRVGATLDEEVILRRR